MAKYCVLGQSNSIRHRGFVWSDEHQLVRAGRIGSSPSTLIPFFADGDFFEGCDYCLIDVHAFDAVMISHNAYDIVHHLKYLEWVGHMARKSGCEPIFVIIPMQQHWAAPLVAPMYYSAIESVIRTGRYYFVDLREIIAVMAKERLVTPEEMYEDDAHPIRVVFDVLARKLASFLRGEHATKSELIVTNLPEFTRINLSAVADSSYERSHMATSLFTFNGIKIRPDHPLKIIIPPRAKLAGMMINVLGCNSNVAISGTRTIIKDLRPRPYKNTVSEFRLLPSYSDVYEHNGAIKIALTQGMEKPDEGIFPGVQGFVNGDQVEISDLLFEMPVKPISYLANIPEGRLSIC